MQRPSLTTCLTITASAAAVLLWFMPAADSRPLPKVAISLADVATRPLFEVATSSEGVVGREGGALAEAPKRALVVVVTKGAANVSNATVSVCTRQECLTADSAPSGYVLASEQLERMALASPLLMVGAEGCSTTTVDLNQTEGVLHVELEDEVETAGRVTLDDGAPPPGTLSVVAWPRSDGLSMAMLRRTLSTGSGYPIVATLADGSFSLRGLQRGRVYSVAYGGSGLVAHHGLASIVGGERQLEALVVWRLFGVATVLRDQDGEPIVESTLATYSHKRTQDAQVVLVTSPEFVISGVGFPSGAGNSWTDATYIKAPVRQDTITVVYSYEFPGYESTAVAWKFGALSGSRMPQQEATIRRRCAGFATVRIVPGHGMEARESPALVGDGIWRFVASPMAEDGAVLQTTLSSLRAPLTLRGVPAGQYDMKVVAARDPDGMQTLAHWSCKLAADTEEVLTLDCRNVGAINMEVRGAADARVYRGVLRATVFARGSQHARALFARRPYSIEGLPPGQYELQLSAATRAGEACDDLVSEVIPVTVQAGQVANVAWQWRQ